jgi:hypothetical protein
MPKLRVHNIAVSLDGYVAGPAQSLENPLGVGGTRLHEWAFATRSFRKTHGTDDGGEQGLDDQFIARGDAGVGATIMGRNMFGPIRGPILLGSGERLFDHLDGGPTGYGCVEFVSSPAVAHVRLGRTAPR